MNPLKFARELAAFTEHLSWAACNFGIYGSVYGSGSQGHGSLAASYRLLIDELAELDDPRVPAILGRAIDMFNQREEEIRAAEEKMRQNYQAQRERAKADDELSLAVECPYCGVPPGEECRTGPGRTRTTTHRGRYRLARHLNDGRIPEGGEGDQAPWRKGAQCTATAISTGKRCRAQVLEGTEWCGGHQHPSGFPDDFEPDDSLRLWAAANASHVDLDVEMARFASYWTARRSRQPIGDRDWNQTWRDWMAATEQIACGGGTSIPSTALLQARLISAAGAG